MQSWSLNCKILSCDVYCPNIRLSVQANQQKCRLMWKLSLLNHRFEVMQTIIVSCRQPCHGSSYSDHQKHEEQSNPWDMTEIHLPLEVVKNLDKELQPFKTLMINSNILVAMELAKIDKTFLLIDLPNKQASSAWFWNNVLVQVKSYLMSNFLAN